MIIIMESGAPPSAVTAVISRIEDLGYRVHLSEGEERAIIGVIGNGRPLEQDQIARMQSVERVVRITLPYRLASRDFHPQNTTIPIGNALLGGDKVVIMAGPSSVESRSELIELAWAVKEAGADILSASAYKTRTSPYAFQGLGPKGLEYLAAAREETGLPVITEVTDPDLVPAIAEVADVLQLGSRNMQNYALLNALGRTKHPVMIKRNNSGTIQEWILCAEYILNRGNPNVALCERGIRTFESETRNTFDINAIPLVKRLSHLPVVADPSFGTGRWDLVGPVARAAVAAGADAITLDVHAQPEKALSDGFQSLKPERFSQVVSELRAVASAIGRS